VSNRLPNWFGRSISDDRCDPDTVCRNSFMNFSVWFTRFELVWTVSTFEIPESFEKNEDEHDMAAYNADITYNLVENLYGIGTDSEFRKRQEYFWNQEKYSVQNKWSSEEYQQYLREYRQERERLLGPDYTKSDEGFSLNELNHTLDLHLWFEKNERSTRSLELQHWEVQYFRRMARSLGDLSMRYKFTLSLNHSSKNYYKQWFCIKSCGCGSAAAAAAAAAVCLDKK